MTDFTERFGAIFQRLQQHYHKQGRVEVHRVEGRYPVDESTGTLSIARQPDEHPEWAQRTHTVVIFFYPDDYSAEERELALSGRIPHMCTCTLIGLGLGPLLHNGNTYQDRFVIWTIETAEVYARLPPTGQYEG